jgi:hypothetical protein
MEAMMTTDTPMLHPFAPSCFWDVFFFLIVSVVIVAASAAAATAAVS